MSVYLIVLEEPTSDGWGKLKNAWPDHYYIFDNRVAFVSPPGVSLVKDVCATLGIDDVEKISGIITEVRPTINGYAEKELWEWVNKAE